VRIDSAIVVGAGPVGLTTAYLLADAGIRTSVVEGAAELPQDLRASTWHPPTLDMLEIGGVADELIARGRVTPTWQIRIHETGEKAEFDLSVLKDDTGHPYRLQCEQSIYCQIMAARLRGQVDFRFGGDVIQAGQDDTAAWVQIEDGDRLSADLVIGCDGARSVIRDTIGADFEGDAYPEITILATTTFDFDSILDGLSGVNYIWKAGGTFSLLHLPKVWRCSFYPEKGQRPEDALRPEAIQRHLDEISPEIGEIEILEKRTYRVHRRIASHYRTGRLVIAGDAAHLNSPKGGMGMNGGIHDAFALVRRIVRVNDGDSRALDGYEAERRPVARDDILAQADDNRARMHETAEEARDAALKRLQEIAGDPARAHAFLLKSSMIEGLRKAAMVD
jgi:3-(3-hydroxy-phenyl)propionate hydroxylase